MAERKAVNKYYPPDWDPRKGSVNKRVGQHPLRDRAKKLSQGILVIRFELPYNIWCGGCGIHIGMGVRYNAEKSKVGNYYSTPIYKFRMKCHLCDNYFEIQTDPQNHDYVILNGARRKEQRWDPVANGQIMPEDKATQKKLATDPMYKLEHGSDDHQKGKEKISNLAELEEGRISMIDDYLLNRMARDKFRSEKKQLREAAEAEKAILDKSSLDIELVEESEEDKKLAGLLKYSVTTSFEDKQRQRRKSIEQRPIFGDSQKPTSLSSGSSSTLLLQSLSASSSSSSNLLSNPLPYQRYAKPKLSQRGEIKQKLGCAIKASYKNPFQSSSDKPAAAPLVSPVNSIQRQLGIKLKASAQKELSNQSQVENESTRLNTKCGSSDNLTAPLPEEENTGNHRAAQSAFVSPSCRLSNTDSGVSSTESLVSEDNNPISKPFQPDPQVNCTVPVKPNSVTSNAVELETEGSSKRASDDNDSPASTPHENSNTGLQALISSYGASDSDSS
ncbi:coiled-coil domain-containing protein 130-like protein [Elysia marginata]|uniref:Coiled-coil domain-containing protein 130-like protein n=1 Tax=Elysia marginata TaxID=1093978 RepID=A0AAV4FEG1_9GAST|nr:coiled-coil domain-containing protein 130-like protein [Elysia marginata]